MNKLLLIIHFTSLPFYATSAGAGDLKLAAPFGDEMVIQREMAVPVWGEAAPGASVKVSFAEQTRTATADAQGHWKVELRALPASSENRMMLIESGPDKVEVKDVLVGEVWLCSGQSNMEYGIAGPNGVREAEIAAANHPNLRLRYSKQKNVSIPQTQTDGGSWQACTPQTVAQGTHGSGFSATGYFFGRDLHREIKVPVGLIQAAVGGTPIEAWTRNDAAAAEAAEAATSKNKKLKSGENPLRTLYNGMVAPWTKTPIRGVIWYQAENNCGQGQDGATYYDKLTNLIAGWRGAWHRTDADFPFYIVQVAPFDYTKNPRCNAESLPQYWQSQTRVSEDVANSGMAHTQDVGEPNNIHPRNKQAVGHRLARLAIARTYKLKTQDGVLITDDSGPQFKSVEARGSSLVVSFNYAKSGLVSHDGKPLTHFEIASADGKFEPAEAHIIGATVVLTSAKVSAPSQVRFGWNNIAQPNLYNGDKIPASPFFEQSK